VTWSVVDIATELVHDRRRHNQLAEAEMTSIRESSTDASPGPEGVSVDVKLEVVIVPVSDVDRAKHFYASLGWRLDADFAVSGDFRVVQFTPPGSEASIIFGTGVTSAAPAR
jgi:hypothetical protein